MSSTIHHAFGGLLEAAERLLERRWVQALLFTVVFVWAWLLSGGTAHSAW